MLFEARDAAEAKRFWADRKKLGAIARRTNAFKMNEDVVLPLTALAEFARFVDATERGGGALRPGPLRRARRGLLQRRHRRQDDARVAAAKIPAALAALRAGPRRRWPPPTSRPCGRSRVVADLRQDLGELLRGYPKLAADAGPASTRRCATGCIVLATHMHAGDGNVHVNIPVLSNDRADAATARTRWSTR